MGERSFSISIERTHVRDAGTAEEVSQIVYDAIEALWRELPPSVRQMAFDWISVGDDSLLQTEVDLDAGAIRFWFDERVAWPSALAEHWLRLALLSEKLYLDERLRCCGWSLDLATVPGVDELYGRTCNCECCALCDEVHLRRRSASPIASSRVDVLESAAMGADARITNLILDGGAPRMTITDDERYPAFAWLQRREDGRWVRDASVAVGARRTYWLARDPRDGVWVTRTNDGATLTSDDGRTWSLAATIGLPVGQVQILAIDRATIWATAGELLLRSTDAGRSFERIPRPNVKHVTHAAGDGEVIAVVGDGGAHVSGDSGATWNASPRDRRMWRHQAVITHGVVAVFAHVEEGDVTGGTIMVSRDAGASWATAASGVGVYHAAAAAGLDGRWWWSVSADDHTPRLYVADAVQGPWYACARATCHAIHPDPLDRDVAWLATNELTLLRVRYAASSAASSP